MRKEFIAALIGIAISIFTYSFIYLIISHKMFLYKMKLTRVAQLLAIALMLGSMLAAKACLDHFNLADHTYWQITLFIWGGIGFCMVLYFAIK